MPGSSRTFFFFKQKTAYEIPAASRASTVLSGSLGTNRMRPFPSRLIPSVASTAFRLTANQSRDLAVRQDLGRLAAEHERRNALATMRGHEDKVTPLRPGRIDDAFVRVIVHHVGTLARHTRRPGDLPNECQIAFSPVLAVLLVRNARTPPARRLEAEVSEPYQDERPDEEHTNGASRIRSARARRERDERIHPSRLLSSASRSRKDQRYSPPQGLGNATCRAASRRRSRRGRTRCRARRGA